MADGALSLVRHPEGCVFEGGCLKGFLRGLGIGLVVWRGGWLEEGKVECAGNVIWDSIFEATEIDHMFHFLRVSGNYRKLRFKNLLPTNFFLGMFLVAHFWRYFKRRRISLFVLLRGLFFFPTWC
jgi:hypothetical protein